MKNRYFEEQIHWVPLILKNCLKYTLGLGSVVGLVIGSVVGLVFGLVIGSVVGSVVGAVVGSVVGLVIGSVIGLVVGSGFGQQHILFLFFHPLPQENLSQQALVPAGQGFPLLMHLAPSCFIQELPVKNN